MSKWKMRIAATAILVTGVCIGAAGAQAVRGFNEPSYLNTGLFTVRPGERARFSVSLDDAVSGQLARVLLQFLDDDGDVVGSKAVTLEPGQSGSLAIGTTGRYRAHARVLDEPRPFGARRVVVGTVEVGADDLVFPIRPVCSVDDSHTTTRPG